MFPKNENSHLACECGKIAKLPFAPTVRDYCFCSVSRIEINADSSKLVGRPAGRYSSVFLGGFLKLEEEERREVAEKTAEELAMLCRECVGNAKNKRALVVGLGNGGVTHDSLGARVCEKLSPDSGLYVFPIGVSGKSGIESAELVKSIAICAKAELVIAVDSLAARSEERVGRVIQLSDSGIAPGSGAGRDCGAVDMSSVGVPVISLGVPTALFVEKMSERGYLMVGDEILPLCEGAAEIIADAIRICFCD